MTMHEDPYVFHFKTKEDTVLIVPGMVFTIEPMLNQGTRHVHLNYNDDWTVYTDDGKLSAQWEHTFLVTEDGVEIISKVKSQTFLTFYYAIFSLFFFLTNDYLKHNHILNDRNMTYKYNF